MTDSFDRVHLLNDLDTWRSWEPLDQEDLVIMPHGIFVVQRQSYVTMLRPADTGDLRHFFTVSSRPREGRVEPQQRIPFPLLIQAASFFQRIWAEQKREDILLLYYYPRTRQYILEHPPLLSASPHGVKYVIPATPSDAVRFGSFHSHGIERAYHSPQDRDDDLVSPGLHVVIGHLDRPLPNLQCLFSDGKRVFPIEVTDLFDISPWQKTEFPTEWVVSVPRSASLDAPQPIHERRAYAH